jgi:adenylate kinase family enzyme/YHS domain-containing protein
LWKTYDPVALFNGKVIQGAAEFACHYVGNVFVFVTEENLKAFILEPKKYITARPAMPNVFRMLMLGPKGSGKHEQAKLLSETYGWKVVDFRQLIRSKLEEIMKAEAHLPNNPLPGGKISLSEHELTEVIEGKMFPASKFIPWILNYLGYPLMKKRPPPVVADAEGDGAGAADEEIDEETKKKRDAEAKKKAQEEDKKRREEEERQHAKQERRNKRQAARDAGQDLRELGLDESEEETVIIEDLSIDQIVLKTDEVTGKGPLVGGFILLGFPETQDHIEKLKMHGIEFDKIIYLNDTNEENPGEEIRRRNEGVELYDFDQENEIA